MRKRFLFTFSVLSPVAFFLATSSWSSPAAVDAGWNLMTTSGASTFDGVNWQGVPLGTFDFGNGAVSVGNADTIILRENTITTSGNGSGLLPVALQLRTTTQVNLGAGVNFYYATLSQQQYVGSFMTAQWTDPNTPTTFSDYLQVSFDVRVGSLTGPIVAAFQTLDLSVNNAPWSHIPPVGQNAPLIRGIDYLLNGTDTSADFWPGDPNGLGPALGQVVHDTGNGHHVVWVFGPNVDNFEIDDPAYVTAPFDIAPPANITLVPEPSVGSLALVGVVGMLVLGRLGRKRG